MKNTGLSGLYYIITAPCSCLFVYISINFQMYLLKTNAAISY